MLIAPDPGVAIHINGVQLPPALATTLELALHVAFQAALDDYQTHSVTWTPADHAEAETFLARAHAILLRFDATEPR